ncbi:MAG: OmpA family protein [Bacteroidota bacterium]
MQFTPAKLFFFIALIALLGSCLPKTFPPSNVGREYGNPSFPWVVSHLPEKNRWALARTKHHNFFQIVLCHNRICRQMIGRRKALHAISFEDYRKRIRKNSKKGLYKTEKPATTVQPKATKPIRKTKPDSAIVPVDTAKVAAPIAITPAPEKQVLQADSLITLGEFLFEVNSAHLKPSHFAELDRLGAYLIMNPTLEVSVSGHTDNTGTERHNVSLSTRRAEAVAEYLVSKGVDDQKVFFEGFGSSQPIAGNDTPEGRSKNRRVEILIRNPKKR